MFTTNHEFLKTIGENLKLLWFYEVIVKKIYINYTMY
jgi:hypothetical protein